MPDGTIIQGVPEGTPKAEIMRKYQALKKPERTTMQKVSRQLGLTARAGIEGLTAIPGMIADAPFRVARAAGADVPLPSEAQSGLLNKFLPQPENATERVANIGASAIAGTGGMVKLSELGAKAASPVVSQSLQQLGQQPGMQVLSAGTGGVSAGTAQERGAGPVGTTLAGIAGSLAPYAASQTAAKLLNPVQKFKSPEQTALINQAKKQGFKLTAGQETGNERLQAAESTMRRVPGGGEIQEIGFNNWKILNRNALKAIGEGGDAVTPEILSQADERIGSVFERVTKNATVALGDDFIDDLARVEQEHVAVWNKSDEIKAVLERALAAAEKGKVSGQEYQRIRSSLQKAAVAKISSGDANTGNALGDIAEALDNAAQRSIPENMVGELKNARKEWRNLLTLYDASTGNIAGKSGAGNLDPGALINAVVKNRGRKVFAKSPLGGGDELADLARTATAIRDLIPSSGTAERMYWMNALTGGGGSVAGSILAGAPGAAVGYGAGLATPYLATKAMMSDSMQAYLTKGIAPGLAKKLSNQQIPLSALTNVVGQD